MVKTQRGLAKLGEKTPEVEKVAQDEGLPVEEVLKGVAEGTIVIPKNSLHYIKKICGIGKGLRTKVNANIGTSQDYASLSQEIKKLNIAVKSGADTVMDLSTGGDLNKIRRKIVQKSPLPVGTVPIYQSAILAKEKYGTLVKMKTDDIFSVIEKHLQDGVDFITVHCGITLKGLKLLEKNPRTCGIVSRGGAILARWMIKNEKENPLYTQFDRLLKLAEKYDAVLSLGDALRPGSQRDATDSAQMEELLTLGDLAKKAADFNVQVIIEGPGHIPLNQIELNVKLQKQVCGGAPFYILGPLPTDVACGYDHIVGAIGGAVAGMHGADFLCYITPSEHLGLPDEQDVKEGVIVTRIAAHIADIAKGIKNASLWDDEISKARKSLDWEKQMRLALDTQKAKEYRKKRASASSACSMCGEFCSMKMFPF